MTTLRALPTLLAIGFARAVAYRAEMLVWMLSMTMPLVSLALWSAVAEQGPVGRYGSREFTDYFLSVIVVRQLTGSWVVWELIQDVKTGSLNMRLIKPIHPFVPYAADNLAAIPLRSATLLPLIVAIGARSGWTAPSSTTVGLTIASLFGAWLISFSTMALIGSLSFFMESSVSVFDLWFGTFVLLSGYVVPLDLFPTWVHRITQVLPFRYMLAFPVEVTLGLTRGTDAVRELAVQWLYAASACAAALATFRAGVRRYGAFGG